MPTNHTRQVGPWSSAAHITSTHTSIGTAHRRRALLWPMQNWMVQENQRPKLAARFKKSVRRTLSESPRLWVDGFHCCLRRGTPPPVDHHPCREVDLISGPSFVEGPVTHSRTFRSFVLWGLRPLSRRVKPETKKNCDLSWKFKRKGHYNDGHLYGLPKIHKSTTDPPLRPIISMTGTVTHDIAQYINNIIRKYLNTSYILNSSDQFLADVQNLTLEPGQQLVSLDVESLFTNVPVEETTQIIIEKIDKHPKMNPPTITAAEMEKLLRLCTTATPFKCNGETYKQVDGVSMGSPLGPTYADFYMSQLESLLISQDRASI